jgi:hypothetical protein
LPEVSHGRTIGFAYRAADAGEEIPESSPRSRQSRIQLARITFVSMSCLVFIDAFLGEHPKQSDGELKDRTFGLRDTVQARILFLPQQPGSGLCQIWHGVIN